MRCRLNSEGASVMTHAHQTAPTRFVEANGIRFAYRRFGKAGGVATPLLEKLEAIVREDPAIEKVLSLRTIYTGPEEVVVAAKIHPSAKLNVEQLTRAMDDIDIRIRTELPI